MSLLYSVDEPIEFEFCIMKKLLDLTHENLVNILGGHGIGNNIHGCHHKPRNLCTKISSLLIAIVSHLPFSLRCLLGLLQLESPNMTGIKM